MISQFDRVRTDENYVYLEESKGKVTPLRLIPLDVEPTNDN